MAATANPSPIAILVYHQIDEAPPKGAPFRSLCVSPAAFARQMRLLRLLGYQGLSMTALLPYLRGERRGKVVGITFDDGYLNNLTHALPTLQRHGFSSTCYCVSQRLGQTNVWDQGKGVAQTALMNAEQLRQWVAAGQEVGGHTRQHLSLSTADDALCRQEISLGAEELRAASASPVAHFCYPYGDYELRHLQMTQDAGFQTATTTRRGRVWSQTDMLQLPRVPVLRSTSLFVLWLKLNTAYEDRRGL